MAKPVRREPNERAPQSLRETLTTPKITRVECPVCDGRLKGAALLGYYCTRCGAHYSAPRVRQLRREHLHHKIQSHFSAKQPCRTNTTDIPEQDTSEHDAPEQKRERPQDPRATLHEETTHIIMADDDGAIAQAITEARLAVKETTRHLEDILGTQQGNTATGDTITENATNQDMTCEAEDAKEDRTREYDDFDTTKKDETQSAPQPSPELKTLRRTSTTRIPHKRQDSAKTQTAATTHKKPARQDERAHDPRKKKKTKKIIMKKRPAKTPITRNFTRNSRTTQRANTKKPSISQSSRRHSKKTTPKRAKQQPHKRRKSRST